MTLLWLFVLLWLLGWVLALVFVPVAISWLVHNSRGGQPQPRHVLLVCALPWLVPLTATLAMAALAGAKSWGWVDDHCLFHPPHHPHFCFRHLPNMLFSHGHGHVIIAVGLLLIFGVLALRRGWRLRRQSGSLATLTALSRGKSLVRVLDEPRLMAFAAGKQPRIYLSQGLIARLTRRERRMVLAHEVAHIRHRDLLVSRWLDWLLLLHLKPCAEQLRRLWRDAAEVRADERVARHFGRLATAELLLRLATSMQPAPVSTALGGGDVVARIHILLNDAPSSRRVSRFDTAFAAGLLILLCVLFAHHHALETLLGALISL